MSTCLPTPLISRLKMPCILHRTSGAPCAESFQQGIRKVCEEKVGHAEVPVNIAKHLKIHLASCSRTGQIDPVGIASSPFTSFYVYILHPLYYVFLCLSICYLQWKSCEPQNCTRKPIPVGPAFAESSRSSVKNEP